MSGPDEKHPQGTIDYGKFVQPNVLIPGHGAQAAKQAPGWKNAAGEIPSLRTETSRTFDAGDGKLRTEYANQPINARQADGKFSPIDNSLEVDTGNGIAKTARGGDSKGRLANRNGKTKVQLGRDGADPSLGSVAFDDGHSVGFGLKGAAGSKPTVTGDKAEYRDVLADTNIELQAVAKGLKETVILKSAKSASRFVFPLELQGTKASLDAKSGSVELHDESGKIVAYIPAGSVVDSSPTTTGIHDPDGAPVKYELQGTGAATELVVTVDSRWLADPARVFPVRLDPSVNTVMAVADGWVNSCTPNSVPGGSWNQVLLVGGGPDSTGPGCDRVAFVKWDTSVFNRGYVESASIKLNNTYSYSCNPSPASLYQATGGWNESTLTYSNQPSFDWSPRATTSFAHNFSGPNQTGSPCYPQDGSVVFDGQQVTDMVRNWAGGWNENDGVTIRAGLNFDSNVYANGVPKDPNTFKQFSSIESNGAAQLTVVWAPDVAVYSPVLSSQFDGAAWRQAPTATQPGILPVKVTNAGQSTWYANSDGSTHGGFKLSYHLADPTTFQMFSGTQEVKTALPVDVPPGGSVTVDMTVEALAPGNYDLIFDMWIDGPTYPIWFWRDEGSRTQSIGIGIWDVPPFIQNVGPGGSASTNVLTLEASAVNPDNWPWVQLKYNFRVCTDQKMTTACVSSGATTASTWTPPPLTWGTQYYWDVTVQEGDTWVMSRLPNPVPLTALVPQDAPLHYGADPYSSDHGGVNMGNGNYSRSTTDLSVAGVGPMLRVDRTYNSLDTTDHWFGVGWTAPWNARVQGESGNTLLVVFADGHTERYGLNPDGSYAPPPGRTSHLIKTNQQFLVLTLEDGTTQTFDMLSSGVLVQMSDAQGHATTVTYNTANGMPTKVTNTVTGRSLSFQATGTNPPHIASISTGSVTDVQTGTQSTYTVNYSYDTTGHLTSVCGPRSTTECATFDYSGLGGRLASIKEPNGNFYAKLGYNPDGSVAWREDGAANRTNYADDRDTVAGLYHPLAGARVFDSTSNGGDLAPNSTRSVTVTGVGGVPATGVQAVAANITVVNAPAAGYLRVYPSGQPAPGTSSLQMTSGTTTDQLHLVAVGPDGKINIDAATAGPGNTRILVDVVGWFGAKGTTGGSSYHPTTGTRLLDTRTPTAPFTAGEVRTIQATGKANVPANATAVMVDVEALNPAGAAFLEGWPAGVTDPGISTLQERSGGPRDNQMLVQLSPGGAFNLKAAGAGTDVIVDVVGWFADAKMSRDGSVFHPVNGSRIFDSRPAYQSGPFSTPWGPGETRVVPLAGKAPINTANAAAIVGTLTATGISKDTPIGAYPAYAKAPVTTALFAPTGGLATNSLHGYQLSRTGELMITNPAGGTVDMLLDTFGWFEYANVDVTVTSPRTKASHYIYDPQARMIEHRDEIAANSRTFNYADNGFLWWVGDETGRKTMMLYDNLGHMVSRTTRDSSTATAATTFYEYEQHLAGDVRNGRVKAVRDARSTTNPDWTTSDDRYKTAMTYNVDGSLASTVKPDGQTTTTTYTGTGTGSGTTATGDGAVAATDDSTKSVPVGLVHIETDPAGNKTTRDYDSKGNVTRITNPAGSKTEFTYDELGRVTKTKQISDSFPNGVVTTTGYDQRDQLVYKAEPSVTDPVSGRTHTLVQKTTFDGDNRATQVDVSDLQGFDATRTTKSTYDTADRLVDSTDAVGMLTHRVYDADSNVTQVCVGGTTAAPCTGPAVVKAMTYTDRNELSTTTLKNFADDPIGRPSMLRDVLLDSRSYDPAGRLATVTNARGKQLAYSWVDDNLLATVTLKNFHNFDNTVRDVVLQSNTYDPARHLLTAKTANNTETKAFTLDNSGRVLTATADPGGRNIVTAYTYTPNDKVKTQRNTEGVTTEGTDYLYTALGAVASTSVLNGTTPIVTKYGYDNRGLKTSLTTPRLNVFTYANDELGRVSRETAPSVNTETYQAPPATQTVVAAQPVIVYGYNTFGDRASVKDPLGNVTTQLIDQAGRATTTNYPSYTTPAGNTLTPTSSQVFDALGNRRSVTDRRGYTTNYDYDLRGRVIRQTDPIAATGKTAGVTRTSYDDNGHVIMTTNPVGTQIQSFYDDRDRRTGTAVNERSPAPATSAVWYRASTSYDDASNITGATDTSNIGSSFTYDGVNALKTMTDPTNAKTTYGYALGHIKTVTDIENHKQQNTYDQAGRLTQKDQYDTAGTVFATTKYDVDPDGNTTGTTTPNLFKSTATFDALGRITDTYQPTTATHSIHRSYGYDKASNRTRSTDGNQNATWTTYNPWNLPATTIDPSTPTYPNATDRTTVRTYDAGGIPVSATLPGNVVRTGVFDGLGRPTSETGSGAAVATDTKTFDYDAASRVTSISKPGGTIGVTYNDRNEPLTVTDMATTSYTYDAAGRPLSRTDQAGTANFVYLSGRLQTATDPLTATTATYNYRPAGQIATINYGTGNVTKAYTYLPNGRLSTEAMTNGATVLAQSAYTYDPDGNQLTKAITPSSVAGAGTNKYTYDQADRLATWTTPGNANTNYTWDDNNNRLTAGPTTFTYDARNRISKSVNGSTSTTFGWTARGTLSTKQAGTAAAVATKFDAYDRTINDGASTYTYDALDRIRSNGSTTKGWSGLTNNLASDGTSLYSRDAAGAPVATKAGTAAASLLVANAHGNIVGLTAPNGTALAGSKAYDPWGKVSWTTGTQATLGYQGQWTDPSTARVDMNARMYDPDNAAFTAKDSVNDPTMGNAYGYTPANPLRFTDPSGHQSLVATCDQIMPGYKPRRCNQKPTGDATPPPDHGGCDPSQLVSLPNCAPPARPSCYNPVSCGSDGGDGPTGDGGDGPTGSGDGGNCLDWWSINYPCRGGGGGGGGGGKTHTHTAAPKKYVPPPPPTYDSPDHQKGTILHPGDPHYGTRGEVRTGQGPVSVGSTATDLFAQTGAPTISDIPTPQNPVTNLKMTKLNDAPGIVPQRSPGSAAHLETLGYKGGVGQPDGELCPGGWDVRGNCIGRNGLRDPSHDPAPIAPRPKNVEGGDNGSPRMPDYVTVDVGGCAFVCLGLNFSITKGGDVYVGPEVGVGTPGPSGSVKGGWLNQKNKPSDSEISKFLDGSSTNVGGGFGLGGGENFSDGKNATEVGVTSPGVSAMESYSWNPFSLPVGLGWE